MARGPQDVPVPRTSPPPRTSTNPLIDVKVRWHREMWVAWVRSGGRDAMPPDMVAETVFSGYLEIDRLFATRGASPVKEEPSAEERGVGGDDGEG